DPTYRDHLGRPLLRMTFDFPDNDRRMAAWLVERASEICRAMERVERFDTENRAAQGKPYSVVPYQTTHNTGGTIMGADPATSVVNPFCQSWEQHNVFVFGASLFPQIGRAHV